MKSVIVTETARFVAVLLSCSVGIDDLSTLSFRFGPDTFVSKCEAQHASANAAAEHERHENETLREQALQVWGCTNVELWWPLYFTGVWKSKSWLLARCNS